MFESGNLAIAIKQQDCDTYDLLLQQDVNSRGNTQWFFFSCKPKVTGMFTLNIVNLTKSDSLFNYGMKILTSTDN
jgi:hypothetical protein